jgi:hypothetical protein
MNINNIDDLNYLSERELDTIVKKINEIRNERRQMNIKSSIKRFKDVWKELEDEGVEICFNDFYESGDTLELDSIDFNY